MDVYKTLIIGSSYVSIGYAAACPGTIICEEHQICDTSFYLPLRSFLYKPYSPKTEDGTQLLNTFNSLSLFRHNEQNTNGFEFALCKYVLEKRLKLLLKCRVIRIEYHSDDIYDVTVQTHEGLTHIFAKEVLDMTNESSEKHFTVLFVCDDIENAKGKLLSAYSGAQIGSAFYPGRYALHISVRDTDENRIKLAFYQKWLSLGIKAKILYMAPVFYGEASTDKICDDNYANPIEAFEAGYFYAKEISK
ncbi:MAG: hypothetical protein IJX62_09750 [Clostridia bacterium]|nr:hypothetical protein [Clostridia bacterium]